MYKLNLQCGTNLMLDGWTNIDSRPNLVVNGIDERVEFTVGDYNNLDPLLEDETCSHIHFMPSLCILRPDKMVGTFQHWQNKLIKGGILTVYLNDIYLGVKLVLKLPNNHVLYNSVFDKDKESVLDTNTVKNALQSIGFRLKNQFTKDDNDIVRLMLEK